MSHGTENIMEAPLNKKPEILAPAGDEACFLAALAAGADAIYLGLKHFSARMEAENFSLANLARLTELAHQNGAKVYVAMNTLVKPEECAKAGRLCSRLASQVHNDGLIIQDLAMLDLARQAGFAGGLFLSTLANVSNPAGLSEAARLGAARVILPRELSVDEVRVMGENCPPGLGLEIFVHGALCYCVSGRCYWSSYLGGKSGLRGRCVQPCRRIYQRQPNNAQKGGKMRSPTERKHWEQNPKTVPGRFFSCQDLELGMLAKTLLSLSNVASWKIEGRKKGPHYVYHAVTAYRLLRDNPDDRATRKEAEDILAMALGRPGVRGRFLPQRNTVPMSPHGQTSSGLLAGKIRIEQDGPCVIKPHFPLLRNDYLRIGTEDERWHSTMSVKRDVPKGGSLALNIQKHKTPKAGVPVFLIDRREPELEKIIREWRAKAEKIEASPTRDTDFAPAMPRPAKPRLRKDMLVMSSLPKGKGAGFIPAVWLSGKSGELSPTLAPKLCWWLPPVIWPEEEDFFGKAIYRLLRAGARHFVCNAPWQAAFFTSPRLKDLDLVAGPFCNIANALAIMELEKLGFAAAFASPELDSEDLLGLPGQSPLPLGLVISGFWPVGLSRFGLSGINANEVFSSPRGELFWNRRYGQNVWIYPGWPLDLQSKRKELLNAGYSFFAVLDEKPPQELPRRERNGLFNWAGSLL